MTEKFNHDMLHYELEKQRQRRRLKSERHEPSCMAWQAWDVPDSCTCGASRTPATPRETR